MSEGRISGGQIAVLGALFALSATTIDIIIPLIPLITRLIGGSPHEGPLLISGYLLGYGAAQFLWGLLSDRFGRKPIILISLIGFIVISLLCSLVSTMSWLLILRLLQGVFGAAGPVLARAIARDFGARQADQTGSTAKLLSHMTAMLGLAPLLAPLVGTLIGVYFGWAGIFIFLGFFSFLTLFFAMWLLPETLSIDMRRPLTHRLIFEKFGRLFHEQEFWLGTLVLTFLFGGYFIIIAGSAAVLEAVYKIETTAFTGWFVLAAFFYVAGSLTNRALLQTRTPLQNLNLAKWFVVAVSLLFIGFVVAPVQPFWVLWALVCFYIFCTGFILPNATAIAMARFQDIAGTASSAMGFLQIGGGAFITWLYTRFSGDEVGWFALAVGLTGLLMLLPCWIFGRRVTN